MADKYNLRTIMEEAAASEDNFESSGEFLRSTLVEGGTLKNGHYKVRIKHVTVIEANTFGLPGFGLICEFLDGDYKGEVMYVASDLTTFDFLNKRVIENLRNLGVPDELIERMDSQAEVIVSMLKGKEVGLSVKFTPNPKNKQFPRTNHVFDKAGSDIPEMDDDIDDDY